MFERGPFGPSCVFMAALQTLYNHATGLMLGWAWIGEACACLFRKEPVVSLPFAESVVSGLLRVVGVKVGCLVVGGGVAVLIGRVTDPRPGEASTLSAAEPVAQAPDRPGEDVKPKKPSVKELRQRYPFESLAERLAYERERPAADVQLSDE